MISVKGYAVHDAKDTLKPFSFTRRAPKPKDIVIKIHFCGICHSDIHQARNEWGSSTYPMVPGHEIAGVVESVGAKVKKFKVGDHAGVGCFVDSCRKCKSCREGLENYCEGQGTWTYNGVEQDKVTRTQGGYSTHIVVDENYALKISKKLPLDKVAPLLCAGITTYSPLKYYGVKRGMKIAVVGMGGLGHMAVKLASSMGAIVTVISTSRSKEKDARRFGAKGFVLSTDKAEMEYLVGRFDFVLDTVSAEHDMNALLSLLKRDATMIIVGVPQKPASIQPFSLIIKRRKLAGSVIGGIRETQQMLDYCTQKGLTADVEVIPMNKVNEAYERILKGDVRYRFVIDTSTI